MFQNKPRYLDELNRTMLITALVLTIIDLFFFQFGTWPRYVLSAVSAALLILLVLRMTSRNQNARYQENMKFLSVVTAVRNWFRRTFQRSGAGYAPRAKKVRNAKKAPTWNEMKQYKYLICPQCTQRLRVPRGKGRIRVTCTHCGNVFEAKS
ncbi:MAG: zinc ribbon domain-containing protein [Eubacteriales bacterium]|nr:zinc ribbon domain-containing protein [Eubacteriales bacterium]